jgi:hypothetical protein
MQTVQASHRLLMEQDHPDHPMRSELSRDDLANAKQISTILPTYIPPLSGVVNCDNVPRDFEYALVTTYLPKGDTQCKKTKIRSQC